MAIAPWATTTWISSGAKTLRLSRPAVAGLALGTLVMATGDGSAGVAEVGVVAGVGGALSSPPQAVSPIANTTTQYNMAKGRCIELPLYAPMGAAEGAAPERLHTHRGHEFPWE